MSSQDLVVLEKKLLEKEDRLDKEKEKIQKAKEEIAKKKEDYTKKLQHISSLTADEAKKELLKEIEDQETASVAKVIKEKEETAKRTADKKAQEILVEAMRHGALSYIAEYTVSIIKVTDEEMKGRIIGKEGRNIRAFEQATGVDIDLDEEGKG